jgi:prepilin-type N-terminal cleavage/methylation domain-containing protein
MDEQFRSHAARGMTLIEAMITLIIVSVGLMALVSTIMSCMIAQDSNRQEMIALTYARAKMAELEQNQADTKSFDGVFDTYCTNFQDFRDATPWVTNNPSALNQIRIPDTIKGNGATMFYGWYYIYFPVLPSGALSETGVGTNQYYGNPRQQINLSLMGVPITDINGNGTPGDGGPCTTYSLLPVTIRVVWQDLHTGDPNNNYARTLELHGMIGDMRENDPASP